MIWIFEYLDTGEVLGAGMWVMSGLRGADKEAVCVGVAREGTEVGGC